MASDIWLRTILIVRKETRCRHIGYSYRLTAKVLLYAPSHRQDNTYHSLCYTSRGSLAGTRNSSMGPPHEGSIWQHIAPWRNALPLSYVPLPHLWSCTHINISQATYFNNVSITLLLKFIYWFVTFFLFSFFLCLFVSDLFIYLFVYLFNDILNTLLLIII